LEGLELLSAYITWIGISRRSQPDAGLSAVPEEEITSVSATDSMQLEPVDAYIRG